MSHLSGQKVGLSTRLGLFVSALLILGNYYYLYFVNFDQGAVGGGGAFSLLKLLGLSIAFPLLLSFSLRRKVLIENLLLLMFFALAVFLYVAKSVLIGSNDTLFLNTVICGLPFVLFELRWNLSRTVMFFECCLLIVVAQTAMDTVIFIAGGSLWDNNAFIGGLGNPSSFGFICNFLICYVLFERPRKMSSPLCFCILCYGVLMTSSMLAFLMLFIIVALWACLHFSFKKLVLAAAVGLSVVFWGGAAVSEHLEYKLKSAVGALDGDGGEQSVSVSLRMAIHKEYMANFLEEPVKAVFVGFDKYAYMKYDSQFLTYLSSFGVIFSFVFFLAVFMVLMRSIRHGYFHFTSVVMLLFAVTFLTNRILDYYPIPFFMFLVMAFFHENVARKRIIQKNYARKSTAEMHGLYNGGAQL